MTHEDAGHYAAKHPDGTQSDPVVTAALSQRARDGRITCTAAHEVAATLEVHPSEVGRTTDLLEYRIIECQLGLFGHSPQKRIVKPAETVSEELRTKLEQEAADGNIECASCWEIARELAVEKLTVACACEHMGLKVTRCQLGTF
jgi:hypothetical protein